MPTGEIIIARWSGKYSTHGFGHSREYGVLRGQIGQNENGALACGVPRLCRSGEAHVLRAWAENDTGHRIL